MGGAGEEQGCVAQVVTSTAIGGVIGGIFGSINAAWVVNPQVKEQTGPMFKMTANIIKSHAALVAAIGGVFAATQCTAKTLRGEDDVLNKMLAGCASGSVLGIQSKRPSVGAGACAAFAAMAAAVHLAGGQLAPEDRKSNEFFRQWSRKGGDGGSGH